MWRTVMPALLVLMPMGCEKTKQVKETATMGQLTVTSPAFGPGKPIPKKHAYRGEGENIAPPLGWTGAPQGTRTFAVICEDPDAPSSKNPRPEPWVHWVMFNIVAQRTMLAEGGPTEGTVGTNDFKERSWGGPMPPPGSGTHRYFFRVYALDTRLDLPPATTRAQLLQAMQGHILAQGEVFGTYERR